MNLIKRSCLLTVLCLLLTACGADSPTAPADPPESPPEEIAGEPVSGVIFTYNGKDYDLQERNPMVNALMAETLVGGTIVVEGHIGPNVAYYGIFDTETETFIKDIEGANLTWRDDDISTAAYSLWAEIYGYDGSLLSKLDLSESEYISGLTWNDGQHLTVEISSINSEEPEVLEIAAGEGPVPSEKRASKKRYLGLHEIVPWHQFPIPEAEAFALTGEDASLYEAAVSQFNRKKTPEYFDSSDGFNTDMILPSVSVFGKYTTDEGNTTYVVNFVKCFFYDLGYGLDDLDDPVYTYESINNLASITLDHDGNLVSFDELGGGEDDSAVYRFCGPLTDIAEKLLTPGGWPEESARIPDTGSYEEMLQQYMNYYFER